jgi:mono/diheme cytochrome c family protein
MNPKIGNRISGKFIREKKRGSGMRFEFRVAFAVIVALVASGGAAGAASAEKGKAGFVTHGCWQCHGFEGQGSVATSNGVVISGTALSLERFENFVRDTNRAMPPYRETILSNADLADIYAYLQSIPKPQDVNSIPLLKP